MTIVVNDANILIDLVELRLLCETVNPHLGLPVAECEKRKLSWGQ